MRERWVDISKFAAIVAVLSDHLCGIVYTSEVFHILTYYSVSLFIILLGITSFWQYDKARVKPGLLVLKRIRNILIPYLMAVFIYYVVAFRGFSFVDYLRYVFFFNITPPHYFVLLYLQLVIVTPVLFYLIKLGEKANKNVLMGLYQVIIGSGVFLVSVLCNRFTNVADVYGGGGKLLGGSYLLCIYIGLLIGCYYCNIKDIVIDKRIILFLEILFITVLVVIVCLLEREGFFIDRTGIMGTSINPPGITLIVFALSILIVIMISDYIARKCSYFSDRIFDCLAYIGRHSLSIFLYHRLFLDFFLVNLIDGRRSHYLIPIYYVVMVLFSIGLEYLIKRIQKLIYNSYSLV